MSLRGRTREIVMPWYATPPRAETRGAVWRQERGSWAASDTASGEIELDADEGDFTSCSMDDAADPFDSPTLRLRLR